MTQARTPRSEPRVQGHPIAQCRRPPACLLKLSPKAIALLDPAPRLEGLRISLHEVACLAPAGNERLMGDPHRGLAPGGGIAHQEPRMNIEQRFNKLALRCTRQKRR